MDLSAKANAAEIRGEPAGGCAVAGIVGAMGLGCSKGPQEPSVAAEVAGWTCTSTDDGKGNTVLEWQGGSLPAEQTGAFPVKSIAPDAVGELTTTKTPNSIAAERPSAPVRSTEPLKVASGPLTCGFVRCAVLLDIRAHRSNDRSTGFRTARTRKNEEDPPCRDMLPASATATTRSSMKDSIPSPAKNAAAGIPLAQTAPKPKRSWHVSPPKRTTAATTRSTLLTFGAYLTHQWLPAKRLELRVSTHRSYVHKVQ